MSTWDTPFGRNVRYTVRLHVVGEEIREKELMRPVDRRVEYRVVTPHGELKAVALAAVHFAQQEPNSIHREIEVVAVEREFTSEPEDYRDRDSIVS